MSFSADYPDLPITPHLESILNALEGNPSRSLVLTAETGAGKSTVVPLYLAEKLQGTILMLEPRRLAALGTAARMAEILGEKTGETCGYTVRGDSRHSAVTRVLTMTEAVLSRRIMDDPSLPGVSAVILDEFHERSIHGDFAAALLRDVKILREDLHLVIMSAAFETEKARDFFDAAELHITGRQFPVDISYLPPRSAERLEHTVARAVETAGTEGDILVFLPGLAEIRRTENVLRENSFVKGVFSGILTLHSSISLEEQRRVLQKNDGGRRIILSSSIAETSLTVPGVRTVIDSGLSRITRFSGRTGMNRLVTEPENRFSALQRTGRAGRTAPGICIRLWEQNDERPRTTPCEILRSDLMPLVLDCAVWSRAERNVLNWPDTPPEDAWNNARNTLERLGALNAEGIATQKGLYMQRLGIHPRPAAVVLTGIPLLPEKNGELPDTENSGTHTGTEDNTTDAEISAAIQSGGGNLNTADICALAAIAEDQGNQSGILSDLLRQFQKGGADPAWKRRVETASLDLQNRLRSIRRKQRSVYVSAAELMLNGYPDRICRLKDAERALYQFPSGRTAVINSISAEQSGSPPEYLVALTADSGEREGRIYLYEPLGSETARVWLDEQADEVFDFFWDNGILKKVKRRVYGSFTLSESFETPTREENAAAFARLAAKNAAEALPWDEQTRSFAARLAFYCLNGNCRLPQGSAAEKLSGLLRSGEKNIRDCVGTLFAENPDELLFPFLPKKDNGSWGILSGEALLNALKNLAGRETVSHMETQVPETFRVPSGASKKISYTEGSVPVLEVKIQEMFGMSETPRIRDVPLLLHLLSPAGRPLQITRDLAHFWKETWPQVVREMKGRYPKHPWPDNPFTAEATWKTKRKKD